MDLYYQNETLYIDINHTLTAQNYLKFKDRIFKIVRDYGVDSVVVENNPVTFKNRYFLNQMKHEYASIYHGDFLIK